MTEQSPEFRVSAFMQDIENLKATLDTLGIMYNLKKMPLEVKDAMQGKYATENVEIPIFPHVQFFGRLCMMLEDLQAKFTAPDNEGLIPSCHLHGEGGPMMFINGKAVCMSCLADGPFADFVCDWVDPDAEMPEQKEELS